MCKQFFLWKEHFYTLNLIGVIKLELKFSFSDLRFNLNFTFKKNVFKIYINLSEKYDYDFK